MQPFISNIKFTKKVKGAFGVFYLPKTPKKLTSSKLRLKTMSYI